MPDFITPEKVKSRWEKGSKAVRKQVTDFYMNSLFLADEQWVAQNKATGGIDEIPRLDAERVQLTINVLRPRSRGIIAKATSRPLLFQVPPRGADDAAVMGAQLATEVITSYHDDQDWENLREDQAWVTWLGGTAGLCLDWDPTAGTKIVDPQTRVPISTPNGRRALHTGDIAGQVLSIAEMAVQPGSRNAERALYWVKCTALPPEEAKEMFGLSETPKPDAGSMVSPMQWRMLTSNEQTALDQQLTAVYTYYERPSKDGDGQIVVIVAGERVEESPWVFPFTDRLNLIVTRETKIHGRWSGDTVLTSSRVPQMGVNQSWSSLVEHTKRAGNMRTWVNQATSDFIEELTDEPGEFATYIGPEKPFILAPGAMPNWWLTQPDRLTAIIDEQLGSVEVSRGVAPRNVESGLGLSILSENANSPITALAEEQARAWEKFATMALQTLEVKATEPRTAHFEEMPDYALPAPSFEWTGEDFAGQVRVKVPLDSIRPQSPAQTQAWAQAQFDRGAIDLRQYARLVQLPEQENLLAIADPDSSKAQRENYRMSQGEVCKPAPFDDDHKHIATLVAFQKTERYELLDPQIQELFALHAQAHEQQSITKMAKASERMAVDQSLAAAATAHGGVGSPEPPAEALQQMGAPGGDQQQISGPPAPEAPFPGATPTDAEAQQGATAYTGLGG
jgi:hypothetical protein